MFAKKASQSEKDGDRRCILERSAESWAPAGQSRRAELVLALISALTLLFVLAELVGGYLAHSLAIMTDAFHMLSDLSSFLVSILAIRLSRRPASTRHSFGFQRAEVLGALSSILVIWVLTGLLLYLAVWRIIQHDFEVEPDTMMLTAGIGVFFNLLIGILLHRSSGHLAAGAGHSHSHQHLPLGHHSEEAAAENGSIRSLDQRTTSSSSSSSSSSSDEHYENLNIRAAFVHVLGDLVQSLGVLLAAVVIKYTGFALADPICTFFFSCLVLITTVPVFGDTITILMEASPRHVNHQQLRADLMSLPCVVGVHSLRVWALKTDTLAATVHLEMASGEKCSTNEIVALAQRKLALGHRIRFATIQTNCALEPENEEKEKMEGEVEHGKA